MIVLCTGGESCGTRLAARLIEQMGGEAIHRSVPHGGAWLTLTKLEFDAAILMTRDWWAAAPSQLRAKHVSSEEQAMAQLQRAYAALTAQLQSSGRPWRFVSYESLVRRPRSVTARLGTWLGLDPVGITEPIRDENKKWLTTTRPSKS